MSNTVFEIAQARLKAVGEMDRILAREREQCEELSQLRERQNALLLDSTPDLFAAVNKYEGELIRFALKTANKSVTKAAPLLGLSYQSLAWIIKSRHEDLLSERNPVRQRRRG